MPQEGELHHPFPHIDELMFNLYFKMQTYFFVKNHNIIKYIFKIVVIFYNISN